MTTWHWDWDRKKIQNASSIECFSETAQWSVKISYNQMLVTPQPFNLGLRTWIVTILKTHTVLFTKINEVIFLLIIFSTIFILLFILVKCLLFNVSPITRSTSHLNTKILHMSDWDHADPCSMKNINWQRRQHQHHHKIIILLMSALMHH